MADAPPGGANVPEPAGRRKPGRGKKPPEKNRPPDPVPKDDPEDDLDDLLFEIESRKVSGWAKLGYFILLLGVAAMVGYLILIILFPERFAAQDWIGGTSQMKGSASIEVDLSLIKSFKIGGLRMGDTPEQARQTFPSIRLAANPNFGPSDPIAQIGQYRHHEGDYRVFFRGPARGNRLFKVESRHTYSEISYLELLSELSGRYGRPQKTDCGAQEKEIGIRCELYWRMSETLIEARIQTTAPKGGGPSVTKLFVQARDSRPNSYFSRRKIQQEARDKKTAKKKKRRLKDVRPGN